MTEPESLSVQDRLELQELVARYNFYIDTFQIEPLMDLWVADDPFFDETKLDTGCHAGLDAIRRFFVDVFDKMDGLSHITGNFIIEAVTDDGAIGVCTVFMEGDVRGGGTVRATGYYDDVYERTDAGWRFRSRTVTPNTKPQVGAMLAAIEEGR